MRKSLRSAHGHWHSRHCSLRLKHSPTTTMYTYTFLRQDPIFHFNFQFSRAFIIVYHFAYLYNIQNGYPCASALHRDITHAYHASAHADDGMRAIYRRRPEFRSIVIDGARSLLVQSTVFVHDGRILIWVPFENKERCCRQAQIWNG